MSFMTCSSRSLTRAVPGEPSRRFASWRRTTEGPHELTVGDTRTMAFAPPARHLLKAKDLADARYAEPIGVDDMAAAAGLSRAHFSREFRRTFGDAPHQYLLTRRLERAARLLRRTDRSVLDICLAVGLSSVGSFTTSFGRMYGMTPTAYRAAGPPARAYAIVPACVVHAYARPKHRTFREDNGAAPQQDGLIETTTSP